MTCREHLARFCAWRWADPRLQAFLIRLKEYTGIKNNWEQPFFVLYSSSGGAELPLSKLWNTFMDVMEGSKYGEHLPFVHFEICKKEVADALLACEDPTQLFGYGEMLCVKLVENVWQAGSKTKGIEEGEAEIAADIGDMLVRCFAALIHLPPSTIG